MQRIWIEPGLQIEDKGPSGSQRLLALDPDVRLGQTVRPEIPPRVIAVLLDEIIYPDGRCAIEGRPMAPPRHTRVDRAVDRDAAPGQWAARDDKVLKTGTRRRLRRSLRSRGGHSL